MPADYQAPLNEMQFVVTELCDFNQVAALPGQQDLEPSLAEAVLSEAARFSQEVLSPLNVVGDQAGAKVNAQGEVACAPGFKQAYGQFVEAGWNGLSCSTEHNGQGLPQLVAAAVNEMWNASCMSLRSAPCSLRVPFMPLSVMAVRPRSGFTYPRWSRGSGRAP